MLGAGHYDTKVNINNNICFLYCNKNIISFFWIFTSSLWDCLTKRCKTLRSNIAYVVRNALQAILVHFEKVIIRLKAETHQHTLDIHNNAVVCLVHIQVLNYLNFKFYIHFTSFLIVHFSVHTYNETKNLSNQGE